MVIVLLLFEGVAKGSMLAGKVFGLFVCWCK